MSNWGFYQRIANVLKVVSYTGARLMVESMVMIILLVKATGIKTMLWIHGMVAMVWWLNHTIHNRFHLKDGIHFSHIGC